MDDSLGVGLFEETFLRNCPTCHGVQLLDFPRNNTWLVILPLACPTCYGTGLAVVSVMHGPIIRYDPGAGHTEVPFL